MAKHPDMQAMIKKRDDEAKPDLPSFKDLDEGLLVREQSSTDMERGMEQRSQDMEAEQLRVQNSMFDEAFVQRERERGLHNLQNLREVILKQEFVYGSIMAKVSQGQSEEAPQKVRKETIHTDSREGFHKASPYPVQDEDTVRIQHACNTANELSRRQLRKDLQQRNHDGIAVEEAEHLGSLIAKHEAQDRQVARRQQQIFERQVQRTIILQQRRNEQQKILKELQRDQDHRFEVLQLKHHPAAVSRKSHNASHIASQSKLPSPPPGEPAKMHRTTSEPIYNEIVQSHKIYTNTLAKWRDFESDNERRTEAYWRKMLHGEVRRKDAKPEARKAAAVFQQAAKTITTIRGFVKKVATTADVPDPGSGIDDELEAVDTVEISEEPSFSFEKISGRASSSSDLGNSRSLYEARRNTVKAYHQELEQRAQEKFEKDQNKLEEKRRLGKEAQNKKAATAGDAVKAWEKRNSVTAEKRKELSMRNDGEFAAKMSAAEQRMTERQDTLEQSLRNMTSTRTQMQAKNKASAMSTLEDKVNTFKTKQAEMDEKGAELLDVRMKNHARRTSDGYAEEAKQRYVQKQKNEAEFKKKTAEEIHAKAQRLEDAMKRIRKEPSSSRLDGDSAKALDRQRLLQQDKARDGPTKGPPPELALPPDLALSPHLFLSPKSARTPASGKSDFNATSPASRADLQSSRTSCPRVDELELEMMGVAARTSPKSSRTAASKANHTPSSTFSMNGALGSFDANLGNSGGDVGSYRSDNESDDESEGECNFLEDIRVQSSKWLQDMRSNAERNPACAV